jgi:aldehyde dehydrogenase
MDRQRMVEEIAREVIARLEIHLNGHAAPSGARRSGAASGVFWEVDDAVAASAKAQPRVAEMPLEERGRIIAIIRRICSERADELGRMEYEETQIGKLEHKIRKLHAMRHVLGVEAMRSEARSDSSGLCVIERAPWGVIGMILPATHSVPTMVSNAINVIAAGNTAVFNPHPAGAKVAAYALGLFNREIEGELGLADVITTIAEPTIRTAEQIFAHPGIALLCITGGKAVVDAAMKSGKRVIAAGPGNPPVVVDETADLDAAAAAIIEGAAFDNNLLCIGEKEIFVTAAAATAFIAAMRRAGAHELDRQAIDRLTKAAFNLQAPGKGCARAHVKKDLIGKDAEVLAEAAGVRVPRGTALLFGETPEDHPFVNEEQMMPFVPVVRVPDADAAIEAAYRAEHGYRHTAIIHTANVKTATKMARRLNTTLFVQNAASTASLGVNGPGYFSHTIATPTGEGVTTPMTFTRERQLTIGGALRIV